MNGKFTNLNFNNVCFQSSIHFKIFMSERIQNLSFRILLPQTSPNSPDFDIANMKLRNWVVPGETIFLFVEVTGLVSNDISFHCIASDSEHTQPIGNSPNALIQQSVTHCQVFQNLNPFSFNNKRYYPVHVQIPNFRAVKFIISAFCYDILKPVTSIICYSIRPFDIEYKKHITQQSVLLEILIKCRNVWNYDIFIKGENLRFDDSFSDEMNYSSSIVILKNFKEINNFYFEDGDELTLAYSMKPLNDYGAKCINDLHIMFSLEWEIDGEKFISNFNKSILNKVSDLLISTRMMKYQLFKNSSLEMTITNLSNSERKVNLCFGDGNIQPITKFSEIIFSSSERTKKIEFKFIPLSIGQRKLNFWIEENERKLEPLFPIYLTIGE